MKLTRDHIWVAFTAIIVGAMISALSVVAFRPKIALNANELDIDIVTLVLKEARAHCTQIKAKKFVVQARGLEVSAGC